MSTLTVACSWRLIEACGRDDTIKPQQGNTSRVSMSAIKLSFRNISGYSLYPSKIKARSSPSLFTKYLLHVSTISVAPFLFYRKAEGWRSSINDICCTAGSRKHRRRTNLNFCKICFVAQRYAICFRNSDFPIPGAPSIKMNWGSLIQWS